MGNLRDKFEKEMHDLSAIMNQNCEKNEDIRELCEWYRKECITRPIMGGDHVVIEEIKNAAATGLTLSMCIHHAYAMLKFKLGWH